MASELASILLGISLALWVCTVAVVSYALWHYVFQPWKVMRKDMASLVQKQQETQQYFETVVRPRIEAFTDEELAMVERRLRERGRVRAAGV